MSIGKNLFEACNANQMDQPITANGAWSTRRFSKYNWLVISRYINIYYLMNINKSSNFIFPQIINE